jgi:hypothetical protein
MMCLCRDRRAASLWLRPRHEPTLLHGIGDLVIDDLADGRGRVEGGDGANILVLASANARDAPTLLNATTL